MSLEQDIYDQLVAVYTGGIKPITDLSYNKTGKQNFIAAVETGFDYDLVHNLSDVYPVHHKEKTPDALFCVDDKLFFVEFKEGDHKKADIRLKIHEGIVTLFMFVCKYMPHVTKAQFVDLHISYSVLSRAPANKATFATVLAQASEKHQLKNLEGFLVRNTHLTMCPNISAAMLNRLTAGTLKYIDVHERNGTVVRYNA